MMRQVYKLFLNITLQHVKLRFHNDQAISSAEFDKEIDIMFHIKWK